MEWQVAVRILGDDITRIEILNPAGEVIARQELSTRQFLSVFTMAEGRSLPGFAFNLKVIESPQTI